MKTKIMLVIMAMTLIVSCKQVVNKKSSKNKGPDAALIAAKTLSTALTSPLQDEMNAAVAANPAGANKQELQVIGQNTSNISIAKSHELIEVSKSIVSCSAEYELVDCQKAFEEASK